MLLLIDNYDSFTYNLYHFLGELGARSEVYRNDKISVDDVLDKSPQAIILSPGPCDPDRAGIGLDLVRRAAPHVPVLGVCLGHQTIGQAFGGRIVCAPVPMHGKISRIHHNGEGLFLNLTDDFKATRYHSLMIDPGSLPDCLTVTAHSDDGVIMGIRHNSLPVYGVQFHPESIASDHGHDILRNFLQQHGIVASPSDNKASPIVPEPLFA